MNMAGHDSDPPYSHRQQGGGVWRQATENPGGCRDPDKATTEAPSSNPGSPFQVSISPFREAADLLAARQEADPAAALQTADFPAGQSIP